MNKTSNQQTGEGNAPRAYLYCDVCHGSGAEPDSTAADKTCECVEGNAPRELHTDPETGAVFYNVDHQNSDGTWGMHSVVVADKGEQCVICGQNSWECEHYEEANQG